MADSKQVLIVGDAEETCLFLSELLEEQGYCLRVAENSEAASVAMQESRTDLVLLDIMMARQASYGVLRQMKSNPALQPIPIIIVTESLEIPSAPRWGGPSALPVPDGFIEKPIDPPAVVEQINGLLM